MTEIIINQSVAILCDGNNIERSIHEMSKSTKAMINFDQLIPFNERLYDFTFVGRFDRPGRLELCKDLKKYFPNSYFLDSTKERLHEYYYGSVVPCHKSADIPLSIKATQLASKVDTIIIMSGDSDFVELVTHLKAEGVRVEIASVKQTTAKILVDESDHYHEITSDDWFIYKGSKRSSYKKN